MMLDNDVDEWFSTSLVKDDCLFSSASNMQPEQGQGLFNGDDLMLPMPHMDPVNSGLPSLQYNGAHSQTTSAPVTPMNGNGNTNKRTHVKTLSCDDMDEFNNSCSLSGGADKRVKMNGGWSKSTAVGLNSMIGGLKVGVAAVIKGTQPHRYIYNSQGAQRAQRLVLPKPEPIDDSAQQSWDMNDLASGSPCNSQRSTSPSSSDGSTGNGNGSSGNGTGSGSGITAGPQLWQMSISHLQAQQQQRSRMHQLAVQTNLISTVDTNCTQGALHLSAEERRTLIQEGYPLPQKLPLTKTEQEALKVVRRKIKNKLSAQESRRKRKEYMDILEAKVSNIEDENMSLRERVQQLESANRQLNATVRKLNQTINLNGSINATMCRNQMDHKVVHHQNPTLGSFADDSDDGLVGSRQQRMHNTRSQVGMA